MTQNYSPAELFLYIKEKQGLNWSRTNFKMFQLIPCEYFLSNSILNMRILALSLFRVGGKKLEILRALRKENSICTSLTDSIEIKCF